MILYMFLMIYGAMVMQSVIEEKNNRVLEVVVSSISPFRLMLGKILVSLPSRWCRCSSGACWCAAWVRSSCRT